MLNRIDDEAFRTAVKAPDSLRTAEQIEILTKYLKAKQINMVFSADTTVRIDKKGFLSEGFSEAVYFDYVVPTGHLPTEFQMIFEHQNTMIHRYKIKIDNFGKS